MMISLVTCDIHGRNPAHVVDSLSHYLQGFMHPFGGCLGFFPSTVWNIIVFFFRRLTVFFKPRQNRPDRPEDPNINRLHAARETFGDIGLKAFDVFALCSTHPTARVGSLEKNLQLSLGWTKSF